MTRLFKFLFVGGIGFFVDAGLLLVAIPIAGHYGGRVISFGIAVLVTWALNRSITFRDRQTAGWGGELVRYVGSQSLGAMTNLAVYSVCISLSLWMYANPVAALAFGSAAGLVVNYSLAHWVVFRSVPQKKGARP